MVLELMLVLAFILTWFKLSFGSLGVHLGLVLGCIPNLVKIDFRVHLYFGLGVLM